MVRLSPGKSSRIDGTLKAAGNDEFGTNVRDYGTAEERRDFSDVDPAHWQELCDLGERREPKAGDLLIKQNDPSDCFGIVESGELDIMHLDEDLGIERVRDRLARGQVFGLMGLLLEQPRFTNVRAREPVRTVIFQKHVLENLRTASRACPWPSGGTWPSDWPRPTKPSECSWSP